MSDNKADLYPLILNFYMTEKDGLIKYMLMILVLFTAFIYPISLHLLFFLALTKYQSLSLTIYHFFIIVLEFVLIFKLKNVISFQFENKRNYFFYSLYGITIVFIFIVFLEFVFLMKFSKYSAKPFRMHLEVGSDEFGPGNNQSKKYIIDRNLMYFKLYDAKLSNLVFSRINLKYCDFRGVEIEGTDFIDCSNLGDFRRSHLSNSRFVETQFLNAKFDRSKIVDVQFFNVRFNGNTIIKNSNFENTKFESTTIETLDCGYNNLNNVLDKDCSLLKEQLK